MKEINVVKTEKGFQGWTPEDQRAYAKMKARIENLVPGEFARVGFSIPRDGVFHRKFFAMLNLAFDAWDPMTLRQRRTYKGVVITKNFEAFREDVLILAGFGEMTFDTRGRMKMKAKSISFDNMEQEEFERVYNAVAGVLLSHEYMARYNRAELDRVVEELQRFGGGPAL